MTLPSSIETNGEQPTDQSLLDYLLGESSASDAIEQWLAMDDSHLLRLERLAEVVSAIGTGDIVPGQQEFAAPVLISNKTAQTHTTGMRWLIALTSLAASISLIVFWSSDHDSDQGIANDRLAVVWADVVSDEDMANPSAAELSDGWLGDIDSVVPETASDIYDSDAKGEFASGDDSPPQWLLVAVSQMADDSSDDDEEGAISEEDVQ